MVALVEDSITEEEFRGEPSHKLLIIDRRPLRILLSLKIHFQFVELRFFCYLFRVNIIAVCWFIQPLNGDLGSFVVPPDFEHRRHGS